MILSVSRRTDVPAFYSDWFFRRIRDGELYVRNPMNAHQVSRIGIRPEQVDCIVFWTKNPGPMLPRLEQLAAYPYYFQFTLTAYGRDVETSLPDKESVLLPVFLELSRRVGAERVVWRYDPILFNDVYTEEYHLRAFSRFARALRGSTTQCVISFVDAYAKNAHRLRALGCHTPSDAALAAFAGKLAALGRENGIRLTSCAEALDLRAVGIEHGCCIDPERIALLTGCHVKAAKDRNQRAECGCLESVEVGCYNTCRNGCQYCYANFSDSLVQKNAAAYRPDAPLLCGELQPGDSVTERKTASCLDRQLSLF